MIFDFRKNPGDSFTKASRAVVEAGTLSKKARLAGETTITATKNSRQLAGIRSKKYRSYKVFTKKHLVLKPQQQKHLMLLFLLKKQQISNLKLAIFAQQKQTEIAEAETEVKREANIIVVVVIVIIIVLVIVLQKRKKNAVKRRKSAYL
jgi:ABC-type phosphate transport system permease subunit